jgi:hypothetical protein
LRPRLLRYLLIALVIEKLVQHLVVTLAFYFDWGAIGATVVVDPSLLMTLGVLLLGLFALALWGLVQHRSWAMDLVIGLSLFDILGEFVAQGKIGITITVSFLVATILLLLALTYRRQTRRANP